MITLEQSGLKEAARYVMSEKEAAERCGVSTITMRRMRRDRIGPTFLRLGTVKIGYRVTDVEAWLVSRMGLPSAKREKSAA